MFLIFRYFFNLYNGYNINFIYIVSLGWLVICLERLKSFRYKGLLFYERFWLILGLEGFLKV